MRQTEIVIVGGGPAGMTAAITLAAGGADCVLIDAYPQMGGHYFRQRPKEFPAAAKEDSRQRAYRTLRRQLDALPVRRLMNTSMWSIFAEPAGPYRVHLHGPDGIKVIGATYVLLAAGAYDRPMAFPGWHLPGVMTLGAAQMLLKGHGIRPGKRALVAGSGPLLLATAAGLIEAGTEVVAVLDAAPMREGLREAPRAFWGQPARVQEAWHYTSTLLRKRVPLRFGHAVFCATGEREVERVVYGPVDGNGSPAGGDEQVAAVDAVCVALGFLPNIALSRHLGCAHAYDSILDAFYPVHDAGMETSVPNVFVAGDMTGIGGKEMAQLQGEIAALTILDRLGYLAVEATAGRLRELELRQRKERPFLNMIRERLRARAGLLDVVDEETVICRCEMVRAGQIAAAIADGARDIRGTKLRTRCGMGACQGRYCGANVANLVARATNQRREDVGTMSVRPPLIPMRMGDIVEEPAVHDKL